MIEERLAACALLAIGVHVAIGRALLELPARESPPRVQKIEVRLQPPPPVPPAPPPPPPPPPKPPDPPPPPPKLVHERPRVQPAAPQVAPEPKEAPPTDQPPAASADTTTTPVFGVSMESTSQAGGPAVPVGNTQTPQPTQGTPTTKPLAAPAAAALVTKMPIPQGRCSGTYTDAARAAGIEGVVVLDLVVDEHGRARDITVTTRLDHGLTEAAIAALEACHFTPGEKDGEPVPVRVRGFKIRFVLD